MTVIEFERARVVQALDPGTQLSTSTAVITETSAGSEIQVFVAQPVLDLAAYPILSAIWDNEDDAVFDAI